MDKKYIKKIEKSFKNHTLCETIVHALKKRWPLWWISDKNILSLQLESYAYKKLKKKYKYIINNAKSEYTLSNENNKVIWVCWLQGMDNAPKLVQRCYESLKSNMKGYKINVITEENMFEYIEIPDYIVTKWKKGIISFAHFSDVIRVNLLVKYGGVWIDSTVLCTDNLLNNRLENSPLFVYKSIMRGSNVISASNWFISSVPKNPILVLVQNLLYEYWKTENVIIHYYLFHIFFTLATEKYPEIWNKVVSFNNISPHILVNELNDTFSQERYDEIKKMSSFHKLNYKIEYLEVENSFYQNLIIKGRY